MNLSAVVQDAFGGMVSGPKILKRALQYHSDDTSGIVDHFIGHLEHAPASDPVAQTVSRHLSTWDYEGTATWIDGTEKNTVERRAKIYVLLGLSAPVVKLMNERFPPHLTIDTPIVIAREHEPWYDEQRRRQSFYLDAYTTYLRNHNKWSEHQILALKESTRLVMERLSDPERDDIYPVRGLVVGYVQSGKTANFTGVIARAADAGYRLIIVLAGTLNILRSQTQRRIDRELIGKPFITAENEPAYVSDLDNFVDHGIEQPFRWHRLTNIEGDYKRLKMGIQSLEFRKYDKTKPFNHPDNLHPEDARLLVVKKRPDVLKKFAADLGEIRVRSRLADIPTLVIDDESDQASVNTKKPTLDEIIERTATNSAIVSLLQQLPRAQYVGYTATPFANVFVDPNLEEDLFPRDFIISLPRPDNYMGVADFHDLDWNDDDEPGPNERDFVRNVRGADENPINLQRAIDSYILSGAVKLWRQAKYPDLARSFRHHTMLVHSSQTQNDHAVMANIVEQTLRDGGYISGKAWPRLEKLWNEDFALVSKTRASDLPVPRSFKELTSYLGDCWSRLEQGPKRVLVVNGDAKDNPDFESDNIWKIVVGGAKLSRGYTIEGLTISYYRRRAGAADTLMQMGRWFGYRPGYRDLVRLFIGREEKSKRETIDLYKAFEAVCRDELEFRNDLKKYSNPQNGRPLRPIEVPPLVPAHLLQPTAKNKMYNAFIQFQNFGGAWKESTILSKADKDIAFNIALLEKVLPKTISKGDLAILVPSEDGKKPIMVQHSAQWTNLKPPQVLKFLEDYKWHPDNRGALQREIEFLQSDQDIGIDSWLFLSIDGPKQSARYSLDGSSREFRPFNRSRVDSGRFKVFSEPDHHSLAEYLCCLNNAQPANDLTASLRKARQGIFVFYPVRERGHEKGPVSPGFALQFPKNNIQVPIRFGVHVEDQPDAVVVNEDAD
ncbi:hypothetical protein BLA6993_05472 [Burkholderia lata]|uniref:Z1 domain-containing protein n=1 Tax=Burkholderia lata (strain ATCC 17760 / DSM 23089 / LMG 22485 / NCIMB 9086 / R18194 / 383) TaxID=482957 RepID=UPI0014542CA1|nr:Z1 domain-containing protein [Burkholderia lata]VWC13592.1 hypothetical protein BLA6993_05472 [Burkholderia lata]